MVCLWSPLAFLILGGGLQSWTFWPSSVGGVGAVSTFSVKTICASFKMSMIFALLLSKVSTSNFAAYLEVVCESKQMAEYWSRDLQDLVLGPEESCHLLNLVDLLLIYC